MTEEAYFGWLITVESPGGGPPQVYNVAILEERLAVEAVKRVLPNREGAIVKIKSKLTKQLSEALKMKTGDVMLGARKKRPRDANRLTKSIADISSGDQIDASGNPIAGKDPVADERYGKGGNVRAKS